MKKIIYSSLFLLFLILTSCLESSDEQLNKDNFTRIYDVDGFNTVYFPIDMRQTPDGGFLVLGGRKLEGISFTGIYLMKVDALGNFERDINVDQNYVHPIAGLAEFNGSYHFVCMTYGGQQVQIAHVDANLQELTFSPAPLTYPAAASFIDNSFFILGYNHVDKNSVVANVSLTGQLVGAARSFTIGVGDGVEEPIMDHYMNTGRRFPFQVGRVPSGPFFFVGFYDHAFSLVFTNMNSNDPTGIVHGRQFGDGGFSAIQPLGGNRFAAARHNFGDNFLHPNLDLAPSSISQAENLEGGYSLPELVPDATVKILRTTIANKNTLIYGSDTRSKQIGLFFYEEANGTFMSSRYLGFSNPFEISAITPTRSPIGEFDGIAVCGTTYLAGRFSRIFIIKISRAELETNIR